MRCLLVAFAALLVIAEATAAQAPLACEDQLRILRNLVEQYASSRQRQEVEAAQAIAALQKEIERLRAERATSGEKK